MIIWIHNKKGNLTTYLNKDLSIKNIYIIYKYLESNYILNNNIILLIIIYYIKIYIIIFQLF